MPSQPRLILASSSRYRKELLSVCACPSSRFPRCGRNATPGETPEALALRLSVAKAQAVVSAHPGCVVIGSDQVATVDGQPIGKPGDFERARVQLRALAGQTVEFHSALAVTDGVRTEKADIVTRCRFRPLSDQAIDAYLRAEEPYDTAGSAKAESLGIALMESIQSDDPTAIIGLPLIALTSMLARFGLDPLAAPGAAA